MRRAGTLLSKKSGGACADGAEVGEQFFQSQASERGLTAPADKFAADAMARIFSRFEDRHRHRALAQADAERQPGQTAADNRNGLGSGHV